MSGRSFIVLLIVFLYPLYRVYLSLSYRLAVHKAGCSLPRKYHHKDPILGLDLFLRRVNSMKLGKSLALDSDLFDTYGRTVQTNAWATKQYVTMDPRNIQTICATEVDKFGSAPMNNAVCQPLLGDGIITTDGMQWKRSRNLVNPIFARAQVSELAPLESHVQRLLTLIPMDESTVDMQPLLKMLFLDSNTEFIFGRSANALAPEKSNIIAQRLPSVFDDALRGMRKRFILGKLRFLAGRDQDWLRKCREVHNIIDSFIDEEMELKNAPQGTSSDTSPYSYVLLKELVKTTDDRLFIRNQLMNVFFPARDTSAILTGNIIFLLARHPEVWDTLRAEVLDIGEQRLTFELLKSMKYMSAVINETLRLLNPVARSWKTCLESCVLPRGGGHSGNEPILLQPGDQVDMSFALLHVDPEIWGEDSRDFRPERWHKLKQSWNFIPFFGGRRICPAQQNVLTDVSYILVRLMQKFKRCENRDDCLDYIEEFVFTKESRNGVKVSLVPVEAD